MCGINGIAYTSSSGHDIDETRLSAMRDAIVHRGPDDKGSFINGKIGLGHRRLSIVDVARGAQPMFSADRSKVLVFNGEIYNHADHRPGLEAEGYRYTTSSDTETILYLYEEFGYDCVEKVRGMFAFAIWDATRKELFIARDRLGIKPLYYVHDDNGNLFFASEIKSLIVSGAISPKINYDVLPDQLANPGTSFDETLYKDVRRLLPGHFMIWSDGRLRIKSYWDISYEPKSSGRTEGEFISEWLEKFRESVELRLMSDVPLGMFLSGGIDSSAICALMSEMVDEPIKTFSVGFEEREANEFEYARTVAKAFKTDHHEITITPDEFFGALPKLIYHEDEPLGFLASVPLYFVSKLAREHVKVVLTGEGSDELMAGYGRYRKAVKLQQYGERYESLAPTKLRDAVKTGVEALPAGLGRKLNRTFLSRDADVEGLLFDNFAIFSKSVQRELLSERTLREISDPDPYRHMKKWFDGSDATEVLDKILYTDAKTYLQELLMKQDQMSMAASIESRVPFLDHELVELTAKLPVEMKLRGKTTKWILREAMRRLLPDIVLDRPKMGFPVPLGNWLRGPHKHVTDEFVLGERTLERGIFNADTLRRLAREHSEGVDHDLKLFFLINFEIWIRQTFEGEEVTINGRV